MKTENQNYQLDKPEEYAENQMDVSVDKAAEKEKSAEKTGSRAGGRTGGKNGGKPSRAGAKPAPRQTPRTAGKGEGRTGKPAAAEKKPSRTAKAAELKGEGKPKVKIIPLGGLEQIGMNITAFEYEDTIVVVDCGLAFPTDDMLGIDLVIPDVTYLEKNIDKVKGFVITHGHEDHIGALPYILQKINVPVYGTKLTIGLIENKLKEHNLMKSTEKGGQARTVHQSGMLPGRIY